MAKSTGTETNLNHSPATAFGDAVNDNQTYKADMTTDEIG